MTAIPPARPKMCAVHSSAALVVNTFARWKEDPSGLSLCGMSGFQKMRFEAQCPSGLRGTPSHLDVLLEGSDGILAIESKFLETLSEKRASFKPAYDEITDARRESPWCRQIAVLRDQSGKYRFLDAAQLVKHFLGLAHTYPERPVTLLYLFWEPANAGEFEEFATHRAEVAEFRAAVAGSPVRLETMSYPELWCDWSLLTAPAWLADHLRHLRNRYEVEIRRR